MQRSYRNDGSANMTGGALSARIIGVSAIALVALLFYGLPVYAQETHVSPDARLETLPISVLAQPAPSTPIEAEQYAISNGQFTASVVNWPDAGTETQLSGRAYVALGTRQGYDHILLCHDGAELPWTLAITGPFASADAVVGEHPLTRSSWGGPLFASAYTDVPLVGSRFSRNTEVRINLFDGVLKITEASNEIWAGSVTAAGEEVQLEATFRARAVTPDVFGFQRTSWAQVEWGGVTPLVHRRGCTEP